MQYLAVYHKTVFVGTDQRVYPFGEKTESHFEMISVGSSGDPDFMAFREALARKIDTYELKHLYRIHSEVKIS